MSTINQPPFGQPLTGPNGLVTQAWAFWLQQFQNSGGSTPITGNYVINGSYTSIGNETLYIGAESTIPSPTPGGIFIAVDTGNIWAVYSNTWVKQVPAFNGDVSNAGAHSTTLTLATVLSTPGTYVSPQLTVDSKGRITAISAGSSAAGIDGSVQFNEGGLFAADVGFFQYDLSTHVLDVNSPTNNIIYQATFVPADTTYTVANYLTIEDDIHVSGNVMIF